ncbi:metallophosphoesterase [Dyella sp. C11]|uniref:STAND family AAA ATPase n=1 Tax=Dyella sp. C11 TaxID=2126991 RepID=UPI000D655AE3|nr:metallophosphoesterase [Dyella sp. C11]
MATLIIFLSDIHIAAASDQILAHHKEIVDASFSDYSDGVTDCHLIITGDIAQSGKKQEYELAKVFIENICTHVVNRVGKRPGIVLCPGNHDCDFSSDQAVRTMIIDNMDYRAEVKLGLSDALAEPLKAYFEFVDDVASPVHGPGRWTSDYRFSGDICINYTALNVALTSGLPERQGKLLFSLAADAGPSAAESALSIYLLHQPLNWLAADCAREVGDLISTRADIALFGHEHRDRGFVVAGLYDESKVINFNADVLHDRKGKLPSAFRTVLIQKGGKIKSSRYVWQAPSYLKDEAKSDGAWRDCLNQESRRSVLSFKKDFVAWIDDIGATYAHRRKERLTLSDIFVWPNLRIKTRDKSAQSLLIDAEELNASKFFDVVAPYGVVTITGDEQYGKTTLAKRWLAKLKSIGFFPIYITCSDIKSLKGPYIDQRIKEIVKAQYACISSDAFDQLESRQRVVIIDDFDDLTFNSEGKAELLKLLKEHFGTVILLVSNTPGVELWLENILSEAKFSKQSSFELLQMNFQARMQLIEKWLHIGNEYSQEKEDIESTATRLGRLVSDALGRNLVPSVPLFVLIILQRAESESELETVIKNGSHGFLYEALITRAIGEKVPSFTVDTAQTYLTSYAKKIYSAGLDGLSLHDAESFHRDHCDFFEISYSFERTKAELCNAGIWREKSGVIVFAYPYLYFYFVARFLANLASPAQRMGVVESLIATIHTETSANILLFLAHLGRDEEVLDRLLGHAATVMGDAVPFDAYAAVSIFQEFQEGKVREIYYETSREQALKIAHDADCESDPVVMVSSGAISTVRDVQEYATEINRSFRTLQVLGQILRNHAGSIEKSKKREIALACTNLGLRTLGSMLTLFKDVAPEIIQSRVESIISTEKDKLLWRQKVDEQLKSMSGILSELVTNVAVGTFVRIAGAIGSEELAPTLEHILYADDNRTKKIVGLSVKLEHFATFPRDEVMNFVPKKSTVKDVLAVALVRSFVVRRFYMFPDAAELKREVCSALNISRRPFQVKSLETGRK